MSVEKVSRNRISKASYFLSNDDRYTQHHLNIDSHILDLPSHRRPLVIALHGSTFKDKGAGRESANLDEFATSVHDIA